VSKNITRVIRMDEDLDVSLQERARDEGVSVSFLVSRLIRRYIDWDVPAQEFGTVQVPAVLLGRLYDGIDDMASQNLGRWMAREFFEPFGRYLFGELTFETSVEVFRRMSLYGGQFVFDRTSDKKNLNLVLRHDFDQKISYYYTGLLQEVYSEILKMDMTVDSRRDICMAQFEVT
jgi:hypothetical protein